MTTISDRFRCRRGTATALAAANEVPLDSEIVLESDTGRGKIGDGVTHYNDLLYRIVGEVDLTGLADGDILIWNAVTQKWKTGTAGSGSGGTAYSYAYSQPDFSGVATLLHFEGANGSTSIVDQVAGNIWTPHGDAAISTAWSAYGESSLLIGSAGNSSISLPTNAGFNVGAGDWSIEFHYKYNGAPQNVARLFQTRDGDVYSGIALDFDSAGQALKLYLSSNSASFDILNGGIVASLSTTADQEVLVTCKKGTIYAAVNGFITYQQAVTLGSGIYYNAADTVIIGGNATGISRSINAYLDEFRFTKGHSVIAPMRAYADPGQLPDS